MRRRGAIASRIVAPTKTDAETLRNLTEGIADTAFIMAALHDKVFGNFGASGAMAVLWEPGKSPKRAVLRDRYNPKQARSYTSPGCDWESF